MTRSLDAAALLVLALAPAGLVGQQAARPQVAPVFPVEAHIVWIDVVAADSQDRPVTGLGPEDFEILEGALRRPIVMFKAPDLAPAPRAIAFLIDDISSTGQQIGRARDVVKRTLSKAAAGDRVLVTATASSVSAQAALPDGAAALRAQLDRIRAHPDLKPALADAEQARRLHWGRVEAIVAALTALSGHAGPRALVVIGPPLPYRAEGAFGKAAYERVMRASERAAAPVYFLESAEEVVAARPSAIRSPDWITGTGSVVGVAPLLPMGPGEASRVSTAVLDDVASDSGGWRATQAATWAWAVDRILAPRAYYLLGIPSVPLSWDGAYHPVEVRVPRKDVRLLSRKGYFAPTPATAR
jgi:VWFA-related protein